ncbi:hypothetical protein K2173_011653 [Erythroxylum novogranatense]|uniref:ADP-ribosyl cyclase/cyclic ADP-ribose hydrolase n=1 Tax=Erythroxylum novogranatense TaxID=1862640 RepID=A0AAV8T0G6_9ROSI|nr:hypothetical protein K2173_011653 [Erythroxylum novogranatense]
MASSSSSSSASHPLKYDVFLNFRGEDTRRGFTSHLYAAFRQKALQTFFDDDDLKRGEAIAPALPRAIQDSTVAVLVFSKDYASSSWCLDELAEIIERHRFHGQIVLPVFYEVDPSHLRKQSHNVAAAFVKHGQNPMNAQKIPQWKDALITAASLCGLDSKNFGNDDLLINKIVEDILQKLNQTMPCPDFEHLVGMDSRIKEIKEIFTINPSKTRILGIWGMGGIGKTTTAKVICQMMSRQFQDCCFLDNVRQRAEANGIDKLREELILKVLGEKDSVNYRFNASFDLFLKRRLSRMKVLIVLDDVNNPRHIEPLIGDPCWFGLGSMILITSTNRLVFEGKVDFIHKVELLNYDEALQLFSKRAFKQNYPRDDYASLSKPIVESARGNPLALRVLGSTLNGKNHEDWDITSTQLSKVKGKNILDVLQIGFNDLTREQKDIFLDIACFFKHTGQIYVTEDSLRKIYKSRTFEIDKTLSVLVDKCLIVISDYRLDMHDLLQEMAEKIVRQEDKRSRLWDHRDIYEIFAGIMETEAVETITLDLSKIAGMNLNPRLFTKMPNLRFLNFYGNGNLYLSQNLDYLPNTLRYLRWEKYPLESLPPNFQPKNLVVLELPNSNIKQLWNRAKEDSLLSQVKYKIVNGFRRLTSLSLVQNKSITRLPNGRSGFLEALEVLDLCGCSNLNTFPEISSNIKKLDLSGTAIKQVPSSSVELLSKLKKLKMIDCRELESLPSNFFCKLTSLYQLDLSRCSRFKMLPEIMEPTKHGVALNLSETAIEKLPSFIGICNERWLIDMSKCSKLTLYPRSSENCFSEDIFWVENLYLSNSNLRGLPEDLSFLSFIRYLDLSKNDFERIPATFKQLSQLESLDIRNCKRLLSLPELPSNVYQILADNCRSLKEIWTLKQLLLDLRMTGYHFNLSNCLKLDEDKCQEVVNALLRNFTRSQMLKSWANFKMIYPGSRILEWVKYQNMGDSIQIRLPSHWFNRLFLGFAFYLCYDNGEHGNGFRYDCHFGDNYYFSSVVSVSLGTLQLDKEHMGVFISNEFCEWVRSHSDFEEGVAFFKFTVTSFELGSVTNGIKKCGVIPLYAQKDEDEFCGAFDFPNLGVSKLKRSATCEGGEDGDDKERKKECLLGSVFDQLVHSLSNINPNFQEIDDSSNSDYSRPQLLSSHFDHLKTVMSIWETRKVDVIEFFGNLMFARVGGVPSSLAGVSPSSADEEGDNGANTDSSEETGVSLPQKVASGILNIPLPNVELLKSTLSTVSLTGLIELMPQLA